ncbi:MAG: hypothetical protein ACLP19_15070 [Xanthobacteraceae bacterium]
MLKFVLLFTAFPPPSFELDSPKFSGRHSLKDGAKAEIAWRLTERAATGLRVANEVGHVSPVTVFDDTNTAIGGRSFRAGSAQCLTNETVLVHSRGEPLDLLQMRPGHQIMPDP